MGWTVKAIAATFPQGPARTSEREACSFQMVEVAVGMCGFGSAQLGVTVALVQQLVKTHPD